MELSQFFNLGITEQQAKLGMEKFMKAAIIDKGRSRAKQWLKKMKAKNIKNAKNGKELL